VIKQKELSVLMKAKALQQMGKIERSSNGGHPCDDVCSTGLYYNWWRTQSCQEAYNQIAYACSNSYCIGDCGPRTCDCFTISGDFGVMCRAFSKMCSGPLN